MERTTCYKTKDGEFFTNVHDANLHESGIELLQIFMKEGYTNNGELKRHVMLIAKNFDKFSDVFTKIRNQTNNKRKAKSSTKK